MYEIRPEVIKTFVTDRNIRLPRFQRKQTWNEKKNFQLCISLFKEYPLGVSILSIDENNGRTIRWLLDGRQRRNALSQMLEDPEAIYFWGQKFIGFKNKDQPAEIAEAFWKKINEYIEYEDDEQSNLLDDESDEVDLSSDAEYIESDKESFSTGLDFLLEIIQLIHNKRNGNTGFTIPFDFSKYIQRLSYMDIHSGKARLSARKLKNFLDQYRIFCDQDNLNFEEAKNFIAYVSSQSVISDDSIPKFTEAVMKSWKELLLRIVMLERIDSLMGTSKIGLIEVKNLSPSDAQKIFNIINSEGEKLTAVEVLSAKPSWNTTIELPSAAMSNAVAELYKKIGADYGDIVKWDLPATMLRRIPRNYVIKVFSDDPKEFAKEITYGFKLLSGIWCRGIKKEDIEKLSKNKAINWELDYENIVSELSTMLKLALQSSYFSFFNTWQTTIMELTSDTIALNYLILLYMDWVRKGKPIGSDVKAKQHQKNAFILWDKLIYEYVSLYWRGSSDSKVATNINTLDTEPEVFTPIPEEKWLILLEEIRDNYTINAQPVSQKTVIPILYHFYCISGIQGPGDLYPIEADHIIPQALFKNRPGQVASHVDSLYNFGLLPKNENVSKSNKRLVEIQNEWLKSQIQKYEFVEEVDYIKYSDIGQYETIYQERSEFMIDQFIAKRQSLLCN